MKLPKQWKHWAKMCRLKCISRNSNGTLLIGKQRLWRINCHGEFECSVPLKHFDRWANSRGAVWIRVPRTQNEMEEAVETMCIETMNMK